MKHIEQTLEKIGLTNQEARTYLKLLELKEAKTGKICKETNIASSNIYKILEALIQKGLVNYRVQNNIKIFMPAPPETLNELFLKKQKELDEERKQIKKVISRLKTKEPEDESYSKYKYFEGIQGIKSMWYEINSTMNKSMHLKVHTAKRESYEKLIGFYTEHHKERKKKHIKERMIFPKEDKALAKKRSDKLTDIKFMDLKNEVEWGIIGNKLFMQYITGKTPRGFLIEDKKFSQTFEQVFDNLWKTAKS